MTADDVHEVVGLLDGVRFWLDGGWGVDALLGTQTRAHADLDAAIDAADLGVAERRLAPLGFAHAVDETPGLPARYVLRDGRGRQVDFHVLVFDDAGNGWQTLDDGTRVGYAGDDLDYPGTVGSRRVPCISPALQLRHHSGYEPLDRDRHDMTQLAQRFMLALPETLKTRT